MKLLRYKKRPKTYKIRKLWDRLVFLGFSDFTLWWEPIGPALEMCGHSGGYMMQDSDGSIEPMGTTIEQALNHADVHRRYVDAFMA